MQSYFNLKNLFIYKEPTNEEMGFELTEDSNEGNENGKQAPHSKNIRQEDKEKQKRTLKMRLAERKENKASKENQQKKESDDISQELSINLETVKLKFLLPKNKDIIIREFNIGRKVKAFMVYIEDMVDKKQLNSSLFPQLMAKDVFDGTPPSHLIEYLIDNIIISHHVMRSQKYHDVVRNVLGGGGALFVDNCKEAILIEMLGIEKRSINVPQNEPVIKGSQEAFTENLGTNVSLVRQIIKNENLVADFLPVGNTNHSNCAMMYLEGVANPKVIQEVMKRIRRINSDFILGSSFIQQFIDDNPYMVLPQTLSTERPDRAANAIMQGYVAVIADGTPSAISVPCTFFRLMHSAEDMNLRWIFATFLRLLRYLGLIAALFLPGLYLALILFHNEMIPTELLVSIARSKESVPFPSIIEILLMELSFELIREGAIRVPGVIGQTLGIVGAIILGQAAVAANLVSSVTVIIVSITALGSFTIPNYELGIAIRILRFAFIIAGAFLGFYGIAVLIAVSFLLGCSLKSFGVPYFSPVAPKTKASKDTIIRYPISSQNERPDELNTPDRTRQGENVKNWTVKKQNNTAGGGKT